MSSEQNVTSTLESELFRNRKIVYYFKGISMRPLLREGRDLIIVERPAAWEMYEKRKLKRYDVALYRRKNGENVLHRVMKVENDSYVFCGDHQYSWEYGVTDDQILGVLTGFVRKGKNVKVDDPLYRCYVAIWCGSFAVRKLHFKCIQYGKRTLKKIVGRKTE